MNRKRVAVLAGASLSLLALVATTSYLKSPSSSRPSVPAVLKRLVKPSAAPVGDLAVSVAALAGDGLAGSADGATAHSRFSDPFGLAIDAAGNVYVADGGDNNRVRKITPDGVVSTFAGGREGFVDGAGGAAALNTPSSLAMDRSGNLYVADTGNHAIRKITANGTVTTLAGSGKPGFADGRGAAAQFNGPVGVAVDDAGIVYVADTYNDRIRRIAPDGTVSTLAGIGQPGMVDGAVASAAFDTPAGIAAAKDGSLYVADTGNDAIRKIDKDGMVSTVAVPPETERRPLLRRPVGIALGKDGYLYVTASGGGRILQMATSGEYHPLRYDGDTGYGSDGTVRLFGPRGIAIDRDGSVLVADALAFRVHRLAAARPGQATTLPLQPPMPPRRVEPMPWPVSPQFAAHEVVGLMGEVRGSFDGESRDHFHAGLDIKADVGERVLAVAASKVTDPFANWGFGTLGEGLSVGSLSYIHMRVGRDPKGKALDARFQLLRGPRGKPVRVRVARGTRFGLGEPLGTVNGMAHVHLDYYPGGPVANPLSLPFVGLHDGVAPHILGIGLYDSAGRRLTAKIGHRLRVQRALGQVVIVADAYDQMEGNLARRRLGLYKLGYQLLRADGSAMRGFEQPLVTQVYDRLPRNRDAVKLVYAANSGITVYGSKATHFAYAVTNRLLDGQAAPGTWNVDGVPPGDYILRIYAADYEGLVATEGRDLPLTIE